MYRKLSLIALTAVILTGGLVGFARSPWTQDPDGAQAPVIHADGTLMLSVKINAQGVEVFQVTRKPKLEFRKPKNWDRLSFRWQMFDVKGLQIADGSFDPGPMDLDPQNIGKVGHVHGDQLIPTETSMNVKVPAYRNIGRIAFSRLDRKSGQSTPFGAVAGQDLVARRGEFR